MTRKRDDLSGSFETEDSGSWLSRFLADEDEFDRRAKWRLGSWAVGSVAALVVAILAAQTSTQIKRDQVAAADLARQSQLIQRVAKEAQVETNRLASAIDTLNSDRDRLFSRLGSLEQGLDSVTGSIAQQKAQASVTPPPTDKPPVAPVAAPPQTASQPEAAKTPAPPAPPISPVDSKPVTMAPAEPKSVAGPPVEAKAAVTPPTDPKPVATAPAESKLVAAAKTMSEVPKTKTASEQAAAMVTSPAPLMPPKSMMAPPDPAASKLLAPEPPAAAHAAVTATDPEPEPDDSEPEPPAVPVQRTEFGIDLGGANSIDGLRTLWQRLLKSNKVLAALRPIIMVKEKPPGGTHLRLVAGPLSDAATAAKFCAILSGGDRFCETSVFDGQRLATAGPAAPSKPQRKRITPQRATSAAEPAPEPPKPASLTSLLGIR